MLEMIRNGNGDDSVAVSTLLLRNRGAERRMGKGNFSLLLVRRGACV